MWPFRPATHSRSRGTVSVEHALFFIKRSAVILGLASVDTGFNAEAWLQEWLAAPLHALGNRRPVDVLQEPEGLAVIRVTLLQIQKGSFA